MYNVEYSTQISKYATRTVNNSVSEIFLCTNNHKNENVIESKILRRGYTMHNNMEVFGNSGRASGNSFGNKSEPWRTAYKKAILQLVRPDNGASVAAIAGQIKGMPRRVRPVEVNTMMDNMRKASAAVLDSATHGTITGHLEKFGKNIRREVGLKSTGKAKRAPQLRP